MMLAAVFASNALTTVLWILLGVLIGAIVTWFLSQKYFKNQLKKNPPVNEKMIRAMFLSMGRKPSESQIRQVMNSMNQYK